MCEDLTEKLPATFLSQEKILDFVDRMVNRVGKGKKKYPETYRFNPLEEAMEECVDIANYSMILHWRISQLREKLNKLGEK